MKKIIFLIFITTSLYCKSALYIGSDFGYSSEDFSSLDAKSSSSVERVKIGYGEINGYAVEFSLDYTANDSNIFSTQGKDKDKIGFNVSLIKAYDFNRYFYPYLKVGFGAGEMKIARAMQSKLSYGSFNLGFGLYIPITKKIDIELSYLYQERSYEAIDFIAYRQSCKSKINNTAIGINVRF